MEFTEEQEGVGQDGGAPVEEPPQDSKGTTTEAHHQVDPTGTILGVSPTDVEDNSREDNTQQEWLKRSKLQMKVQEQLRKQPGQLQQCNYNNLN